jgi:hypothetical protein
MLYLIVFVPSLLLRRPFGKAMIRSNLATSCYGGIHAELKGPWVITADSFFRGASLIAVRHFEIWQRATLSEYDRAWGNQSWAKVCGARFSLLLLLLLLSNMFCFDRQSDVCDRHTLYVLQTRL